MSEMWSDEDLRMQQYWRNRGGEGASPWTGHSTRGVHIRKVDVIDEAMAAAQEEPSALDEQVGGGHYKDLAVQPVEYIHANNLGFIEGCIVKYVTRHAAKGGAKDLDKIIHFAQLLKELEYDEG